MEKTPWTHFLQLIKERLNNQHTFDVWFSELVLESYNEKEKTVIIQVPNRHVYEYIEQYHVALMRQTLDAVFGAGVVIRYRLARQEPSFADVAEYLKQHGGYRPDVNPYHIAVPNAGKRLRDGFRYVLGDNYQWLPAYDAIADWLTDNKGRGLLCVGTPGLGKTLICEKLLPVILGNNGHPIPRVSGHEVCQRLDELLKERIVIIDDLGKEPAEATVSYQRRRPFFELCNNAERTGNLLIITTNLATARPASWPADRPWPWPDSIEHRYGAEVLDRLPVITKLVRFSGESMRKCKM